MTKVYLFDENGTLTFCEEVANPNRLFRRIEDFERSERWSNSDHPCLPGLFDEDLEDNDKVVSLFDKA
ncbi:MAG: hypothetical protein AAF217_13920 [Pseudomonadota bacterium]